jgi:hypothetical protein
MILNNLSDDTKVFKWIERRTETGTMYIVTGYFTVHALEWLAKITNDKINEYNFILGDTIIHSAERKKSLDLLNQELDIDTALRLKEKSKNLVEFLNQKKVNFKTLECNAKLYLFKHSEDEQKGYYITCSSNLTLAALGLSLTNTIDLNTAISSIDPAFKGMEQLVEDLWNKREAQEIIKDENGKRIAVKQYLMDNISKICVDYDPNTIYIKFLYEKFGDPQTADSKDEKT